MDVKKRHQLKNDLLKRSMKEADRLDAADEKQSKAVKMAQLLYEIEEGDSLSDDVIDGNEELGEGTLKID